MVMGRATSTKNASGKKPVENWIVSWAKSVSYDIGKYAYWSLLAVLSGLVFPWLFWIWYPERKSPAATHIPVLVGLGVSGVLFLIYLGFAVHLLRSLL